MIRLLLAGFFAAGCYAKCWNVTRGEDHMIAQCMDDDTQEPFTFYNYDLKPSNDNDTDFEYMADSLYEQYASYVPTPSNETSTDVERRGYGKYWSDCANRISGYCTATSFAGIGALAAVATAIIAALAQAQQDNKLDTTPSVECTMMNKQQVCIGYALRYYEAIGPGTLSVIGKRCSQECAQQNEECVFTYSGDNLAQTQCVTSKSVKCKPGENIRPCD